MGITPPLGIQNTPRIKGLEDDDESSKPLISLVGGTGFEPVTSTV